MAAQGRQSASDKLPEVNWLQAKIIIEDAYGESPPPPAFWKRLGGQTLGQSLAKLSDNVFPQPFRKLVGEHLGEAEGEE